MATEDRRIRKTKKAMTDALAILLSEKPLKTITVRDIANLADINRGTFYLHYHDVYDMVQQLENELFEKFNNIVDSHDIKKNTDEIFPFLVELFNLLAENSTLAKVLISKNGDAAFINKLKHIIQEKCFINIQDTFNAKGKTEFEYFYNYIVSGCIGLCYTWLANGMTETPTEIAEFTKKLIIAGINVIE